MSLLYLKPSSSFQLYLEWNSSSSLGTVSKALQILNPEQLSSQILDHHHPLHGSLFFSLCFKNTSSLPHHGLDIHASLCLELSQPDNPYSAFKSELRSHFLRHAFPSRPSKAGLTCFSLLKHPVLCLHIPHNVLLLHIYSCFYLWILV